MDKNSVLNALNELRANFSKRKFKQSIDLIVNLKDLNLKRPEENINDFLTLKNKGKKSRIGALVGHELVNKAKECCDVVVSIDDFANYTDKKQIKQLADSADFFIAQAELMPKIATIFGKVLGPAGKMPNPKAGCIVPKIIPTLKPVADRLRNTIRLQTKNEMIIKCIVGSEELKDDEIADNVMQVYDFVLHKVPQEKQNIKNAYIKLTMGKPVLIGKEIGKEKGKENAKENK